MGSFVSMLIASLPNIFLGVLSRLLTEKMLTRVVERVLVYGSEKAAKMTTNTLDDELAAEIKKRFESAPGDGR